MMTPETEAASQARITADWLAYGRAIDQSSLALTLLALAGIFWGSMSPASQICCFGAAVLGGVQKYFALRSAFDQRLFAAWAHRWESSADPAADLAALDATLAAVGLRPVPTTPGRPLAERVRGAFRLLKGQLTLLALQFAMLLLVGWNSLLPLVTP